MVSSRSDNNTTDLSERDRAILKSVVTTYIATADPVGSRTVARHSGLGLSPATIRNCMADLEDAGLLYQPHASAGRIPSHEGMRYYVSHLLDRKEIQESERLALESAILSNVSDFEEMLKRAVKVIASWSGNAAVVTTPHPGKSRLIHVDFVQVKSGTILVITVSDSGTVHNHLVQIDCRISSRRLRVLAETISAYLERMDPEKLKQELLDSMEEDRKFLDLLLGEAITSSSRLYGDKEIIIDGRLNLLDYPEFSDIPSIRALFEAFEEKKILVALLERCIEMDNTNILIGSDGLGQSAPDSSVVIAPYREKGTPVGSIGIVGPARMDYARAVALVEYVSHLLSRDM
jgi:heat-inducible transcriptional repressor